jgi:AraC family transcriptional regulator, arabinose operon regulatory protein
MDETKGEERRGQGYVAFRAREGRPRFLLPRYRDAGRLSAMQFLETEHFLDVISRAVASGEACPALAALGVEDVGITHAGPRWCFVRPSPPFALVLLSISGRGSVIHGGEWEEIGPETAYVMPQGRVHGYRVAPDHGQWQYAWVRFSDPSKFGMLFAGDEPRVMPAGAYSLQAANRGLIAEVERSNDPQLTGLWVDLIQASLQRLVRPDTIDPRLANLWAYVNERLGEPWDVERMARHAHLSGEHLRRLCQRHFGCSPRQRLTKLRLRRACELLRLTNGTLFAVATSVGFSDPFTFSQAFKREFRVPPSVYREREKRDERTPNSGVA